MARPKVARQLADQWNVLPIAVLAIAIATLAAAAAGSRLRTLINRLATRSGRLPAQRRFDREFRRIVRHLGPLNHEMLDD